MAGSQYSAVRQFIRRILGSGNADQLPDGQLLERYVSQQDEAAFTALVQRYGPLVYGVCQRVLQDGPDAEDAFQATFLVLVRKAAKLDRRGSLGNWIYTVAYRTAVKARANAARRRAHERQALAMAVAPLGNSKEWEELRPVVDEELHRLPTKYRAPLILCYLEGKTNQEAAKELGWPSGSVSRRMARAREMLRQRLINRGIALSSVLLFALLAKKGMAAVPATLEVSTAKAALGYKAKLLASGGPRSAEVAALADEVLKSLKAPQLSLATSIVVAASLLVAVGSLAAVYSQAFANRPGDINGAGASSGVAGSGMARIGWQRWNTIEGHAEPVLSLAFNIPGTILASGSRAPESSIKIWDIGAGKERTTFLGHRGSVHALAFSPDGKTLASASEDKTVKLWDLAGSKPPVTLDAHTDEVLTVAFSPNGKALASGGADHSLILWNLATGKPQTMLSTHQGPVSAVTYSFDGRFLASAGYDGKVILWNLATGRELAIFRGHTGVVRSAAFSPSGKMLVSGGWDRTVRVWDLSTRMPLAVFFGHTAAVRSVAFSPEGEMVISGSQDKTVRIWDIATGDQTGIFQGALGHHGSVNAVTFTRNSMFLATGSSDQSIKIWQLQNRRFDGGGFRRDIVPGRTRPHAM